MKDGDRYIYLNRYIYIHIYCKCNCNPYKDVFASAFSRRRIVHRTRTMMVIEVKDDDDYL